MTDVQVRLTDKSILPDDEVIKKFIGSKNFVMWQKLQKYIDKNYKDVFAQNDWIYGGQKHGWCLRYKKSKSFCTMIPEKGKFLLLIVFGKEEREKAELILPALSPETQKLYSEATTYHDGKWVVFNLKDSRTFDDVKTLLTLKRKPRQ